MALIQCHICTDEAYVKEAQCPNDIVIQTKYIQDDNYWDRWYCPACVKREDPSPAEEVRELIRDILEEFGMLDQIRLSVGRLQEMYDILGRR